MYFRFDFAELGQYYIKWKSFEWNKIIERVKITKLTLNYSLCLF
jgi:hypothetical protein